MRFYKANGVRNRTSKKVYELVMAGSAAKEEERKVYARVLGSVVVSRHHYVYVDETTFDGTNVQRKSWSSRAHHNQHAQADGRWRVAVYGAIGTCLKKPVVYMLHKFSSNSVQYREFLVDYLIPNLTPGCGKPILIYDQHSSHESDHVWPAVTRAFQPLPQVSYSSNFNSIETVWSVAKRYFYRRRLAAGGYLDEASFRALVAASLDQISAVTAAGILNVNRAYIRDYLEKQLPEEAPAERADDGDDDVGGGEDDDHN